MNSLRPAGLPSSTHTHYIARNATRNESSTIVKAAVGSTENKHSPQTLQSNLDFQLLSSYIQSLGVKLDDGNLLKPGCGPHSRFPFPTLRTTQVTYIDPNARWTPRSKDTVISQTITNHCSSPGSKLNKHMFDVINAWNFWPSSTDEENLMCDSLKPGGHVICNNYFDQFKQLNERDDFDFIGLATFVNSELTLMKHFKLPRFDECLQYEQDNINDVLNECNKTGIDDSQKVIEYNKICKNNCDTTSFYFSKKNQKIYTPISQYLGDRDRQIVYVFKKNTRTYLRPSDSSQPSSKNCPKDLQQNTELNSNDLVFDPETSTFK